MIQIKSRFAQREHGGFEIIRPRGGGGNFLSGAWMFERERVGVKHLARRGVIRLRAQANVLATAVNAIAREWKTEMLEMHANLMRAASVKDDLHKCRSAQPFENAKAGAGFAAFARFGDGHRAAMRRMPCDCSLNFAGGFG